MARDLAAMRRSVEQLAAKQEQMAQTITTLQAVEQDIKQKMSSLAPSQAVPIPPRKPPRPPTPSSTVQLPPAPTPPPRGPITLASGTLGAGLSSQRANSFRNTFASFRCAYQTLP
jgi:hypothetical protein